MTPRERELAAIRHEVPDRIPVDVIWLENGDRVASYLGIPEADVYDRLQIDGRIVGAAYTGDPVIAADGTQLGAWGTTGDYGTTMLHPLADATSISDVERTPRPDPDKFDYDGARVAAEAMPDLAVRGPSWGPVFSLVCDLFGVEHALVTMLAEPTVFEAALNVVAENRAEYFARTLDACGDAMPIYDIGDDFATQRGLMISPDHWRRFMKPITARLFDIGKSRGKVVWYHSCGDISAILPDLIDIGMDVWETVQLHTLPMSPAELKREYGKDIAFFGGINTQRLPFAAPKEIEDEVIRCIEVLGKGGGYILGPDHHIKPDVPGENAVALYDTATTFRREGYTA